jgi:hypothetical protein
MRFSIDPAVRDVKNYLFRERAAFRERESRL